ncbi:MAG: hypothetical protein WD768_14035 [Phycisphaeraceae bacterium]
MNSIQLLRSVHSISAVLVIALLTGCGNEGTDPASVRTEREIEPPARIEQPAQPGERTYQATAKLQYSTSLPAKREGNATSGSAQPLSDDEFTGRAAIEQMIRDLRFDTAIARNAQGEVTAESKVAYDKLVQSLQAAITIQRETGPEPTLEIIAITAHHKDRGLVAPMANKLVENFLRRETPKVEGPLLEQKKKLDTEVTRTAARVQELEKERLKVMLKPGYMDPGEKNGLLKAVAELNAEKARIETTIDGLRSDLDGLSATKSPAAIQAAAEKSAQLEAAIEERLNIRTQLAQREAALREGSLIEAELAKADAQINAARQALKDYTKQLQDTQLELSQLVYGGNRRFSIIERAVYPKENP